MANKKYTCYIIKLDIKHVYFYLPIYDQHIKINDV